jgi:undecaprenyl-diphosphatase
MRWLETKRFIRSFVSKLPLKLITIVGLFLLVLGLFALLTHEVIIEKEQEFDNRLAGFFATYSTDSFLQLMRFFSFFGSGKFLIPAYVLIVVYFLIRKRPLVSLNIGIIAITSTVLSQGAKRIFQRARPGEPLMEVLRTYSFPSGHAFSSFVFCSVLAYLIWRSHLQPPWKWVCSIMLLLFSIAVGMSRIALKMHYPTDVLAGFCLAFLWVVLSFFFLNRIQYSRSGVKNSGQNPS